MLIRKTTAILAAIFLVTITTQAANARLGEFCGDRYCSYHPTEQYQHHRSSRGYKQHSHRHKTHRAKAHAVKTPKPIQVASLEKEPTGEAPRGLLAKAESYLGTNPTGWRSLWCARFIAFLSPPLEQALKRMGLNPNWARDYAELPGAKHTGKIGDLVVLSRGRRGGHIGILKSFDRYGNPIIVSGNHGHKVGIGKYSKNKVLAYVEI